MKAPYFQFYPQDILSDPKFAALNYEEKGVYWEILCRMWTFHDGSCSIPDNDQFICRMLKLRPAKWAKLKYVFLDEFTGVLSSDGERIYNKRLRDEYRKMITKSKKAKENAEARWDNEQKPEKNNRDGDKKVTKTYQKYLAGEEKKKGDNPAKPLNDNECNDANAMRSECYSDTDSDTELKRTNQDNGESLHDPPPHLQVIKNKYPDCPAQKMVDAYHTILPELPHVTKITDSRRTALRRRWRDLLDDDDEKTEVVGMALWRQYCFRIRESPWLMGNVPPTDQNRKQFIADLDYIIVPEYFIKIIEGFYNR